MNRASTKTSLWFLLLVAVVQNSAGFCSRPAFNTLALIPRAPTSPAHRHATSSQLRSGEDDEAEGEKDANEKDEERDGLTWAELQADPEWRELELKKSMKRKNNLLLPQRISAAVTTLGWFFVGGGLILNALGYAWVKDPSGGLGVGTLDERAFQREVIREQRRANEEVAEQSTTTVSKVGNTNNDYISGWVQKEGDSQIA